MSFWDDWLKRLKERRGFFFPEIDRLIEEMEKEMTESFREMENFMPRDMVRVRRLPDGSVRREYGPFVYGYSVKIGPDGKPIIREFGNIKPGPGGEGQPPLNLQEQREPLVDIIEEENQYKVVAELPGVEKEDIKLHVTDHTLSIKVETPDRRYYKELELPGEIDEFSARSTYRNGVLETVLGKKKREDRGTQIKIE
ncbi:MAG: Hsp20/alpha crystallin family protein [Candidatus Bathyarchaeota archaeon]|nr:MAG: Hsp20/alpha crystallin family protein [Candidatus Bathyarchaeota archaeon]